MSVYFNPRANGDQGGKKFILKKKYLKTHWVSHTRMYTSPNDVRLIKKCYVDGHVAHMKKSRNA